MHARPIHWIHRSTCNWIQWKFYMYLIAKTTMYSKQTETCGSFTQKGPQAYYCLYQYIQNDNIVSPLPTRSTPRCLILSTLETIHTKQKRKRKRFKKTNKQKDKRIDNKRRRKFSRLLTLLLDMKRSLCLVTLSFLAIDSVGESELSLRVRCEWTVKLGSRRLNPKLTLTSLEKMFWCLTLQNEIAFSHLETIVFKFWW